MKTIHAWLAEYSESHQHPVNKLIHWICVPSIALSLLGLLWSTPFPTFHYSYPVVLNWATVFLLVVVFYYFLLSWQLAVGMIFYAATMYFILVYLDGLEPPLWLISAVIFAIAWIGQFIGHYIEGKRPAFFKDIQFLLIGPAWLLAIVYRKLHLPY